MTREERAYDFLGKTWDGMRANYRTNRMVANSKKANHEIKLGNFERAEKLKRKSEKHQRLANDAAKYDREKLIDIAYKAHDGAKIRNENKVRAIEHLE
jgi:hypothetical protein